MTCVLQLKLTQVFSIASQPLVSHKLVEGTTLAENQQRFNKDLTNWLVAADIPFHKLTMDLTKQFFCKYTKFNCPDATVARRRYLIEIYDDTITKIRNVVGENGIYFIVDETTDIKQRYVLNVLVGVLDGNPTKSMLISSQELEATNNATVTQAIVNACTILWPDGIRFEKVFLLLSDQAAYMMKAGENLKAMFPNLKHISCLAHALNLVAEKIRERNGLTNKLISNMKHIFSKCVRRKIAFKLVTKLQLPPKVCITRWCTWLNAAFYFNTNFDLIKLFVQQLDEGENEACDQLKKMVNSSVLKKELLEISNYEYLVAAINTLQDPNLTSASQISLIESIRNKLTGEYLKKLEDSLRKNKDYGDFNSLAQNQTILVQQRYAPLTSVDVERSFSKFKAILKPNRESFTFENLSKYTIVNYNSFLLKDL